MAEVIWTRRAKRDFDNVCSYLDERDPEYSATFARSIIAIAEDIVRQPFFGAEVPEFGRAEIRERLFDKYRIVYRVFGDSIKLVAIRHSARLLPRSI